MSNKIRTFCPQHQDGQVQGYYFEDWSRREIKKPSRISSSGEVLEYRIEVEDYISNSGYRCCSCNTQIPYPEASNRNEYLYALRSHQAEAWIGKPLGICVSILIFVIFSILSLKGAISNLVYAGTILLGIPLAYRMSKSLAAYIPGEYLPWAAAFSKGGLGFVISFIALGIFLPRRLAEGDLLNAILGNMILLLGSSVVAYFVGRKPYLRISLVNREIFAEFKKAAEEQERVRLEKERLDEEEYELQLYIAEKEYRESCYQILGLDPMFGEMNTQEDIKKAYKNTAKKYHPDKFNFLKSEDPQKYAEIEEGFKFIVDARDYLLKIAKEIDEMCNKEAA